MVQRWYKLVPTLYQHQTNNRSCSQFTDDTEAHTHCTRSAQPAQPKANTFPLLLLRYLPVRRSYYNLERAADTMSESTTRHQRHTAATILRATSATTLPRAVIELQHKRTLTAPGGIYTGLNASQDASAVARHPRHRGTTRSHGPRQARRCHHCHMLRAAIAAAPRRRAARGRGCTHMVVII